MAQHAQISGHALLLSMPPPLEMPVTFPEMQLVMNKHDLH